MQPVIHLGKCEGAGDCQEVCPYNVFEIRKATEEERTGFNFKERLKSFVHGHKKAFVVNPDQCHACGLCVKACPEKAIKLERYLAD
ncbi:MAG: 4Fe-4S ferredoxin [Bacteroidota bacterium]|nr:4Fe-4S ferredoxin [Bacteroidota bacterium]